MPSEDLAIVIILRTVEKAVSKCLLVQEASGSPDGALPQLSTSSMSYWSQEFILGSSKSTGSTAKFPLS